MLHVHGWVNLLLESDCDQNAIREVREDVLHGEPVGFTLDS